jgi:(1->4)-alpha-D-glucan 1-alpha-D-glucosylmutase
MEAKRHTAWVDGNPEYEARVLEFARQATSPGPLRAAVDEAVLENQQGIRATILSQ